ncbi:MAG: hypothetical protein LIP77_11060 [Planctomycetes bacterium]|nr:hypothetical protein [Planctomycetota bacterium]
MPVSLQPRLPALGLALLLVLVPAAGAERPEGEDEAAALTAADIPTRIARARVGEWALYRMDNGDRFRLTVTERWPLKDDVELVILSETIPRREKRIRRAEERILVKESVAELQAVGEEDRITEAEILLDGRSLDTVVINYIENGRVVRQSFLSDRIPVYGLVRGVDLQENKRRVALNLIDYGYAEEED